MSEKKESSRTSSPVRELDPVLLKRAVRKLDYSILPIMTLNYLLSFIDRANIGNARVAGLQKGLHLTDHQYQVCVTVLFAPYILAELPSNLLLKKIGARTLMPTLLTVWGAIVTLQGLVTSYGGLVAVRCILGAVEGPMFPGITLYLSEFYTRKELALRIGIFFSAASLSGAFSGLLAAAISKMDGVGGKPGWSWIFILEGLFTVLIGILGFFIIPSTLEESKFLTAEEKEILTRRLELDRPSTHPAVHFNVRDVIRTAMSPHVLFVFAILFMMGANLYGLGNFSPSIINQLGFTAIQSQLLSVGPYVGGFIFTIGSAYFSDKYQIRSVPTALLSILSMIGYIVFLTAEAKYTRYGALYIIMPGVYAAVPTASAWMANNSDPHYRRASAIAFGFIATNSGGILSSWMYPTKEGPKFRKTTIMNLVFTIAIVVISTLNAWILHGKNKKKESEREELLKPFRDQKNHDVESVDSRDIDAWIELGDKHPDFRYSL
ncbi:MFS general substrate transporter [Flagelloscypha sp. PMI_526]|nr:MFS general substrate transporter [Flagelloscypha sp. PMI_526]